MELGRKKKERKGKEETKKEEGRGKIVWGKIVSSTVPVFDYRIFPRIRREGIVAGRNFARFFARDDWWVKAVNGILPVYPRSFVTS